MAKICNSKPVKIVLIVAIIILAIVFGFVFYQKMSDEQQEKEANADDDVSYDVPDASDIKVKEGRYYLNGDTNSYYFEITAGNHIQLHCDDMYALFEKWNPGKDDIIKEDVAYWTGKKEYKIVVTEIGTVILAVEWEYDDNSNLTGLTSGPCWLDENTLGKWGQEGDFKYVDSSEYADSLPDSTEISAYYIHHWYGEEPYEITDKDTIHKITAWIENAKSVCKDYPYIDGLEYGGADSYGISLEKDESSDAYESICVIDVSQYSWDTSDGMHSENKICNFSIKDDTGEFQDYNLPKEMIDEIISLITRPNVE